MIEPSQPKACLFLNSPIGPIKIHYSDGKLLSVEVTADDTREAETRERDLAFEERIKSKFDNYFSNPKADMGLPIVEGGTAFQQRVWHFLRSTDAGDTLTYAQVSEALKSHPRAIGQACRKNPFPIITPCHRVVSKTGLGGYNGKEEGTLIRIKEWLLQHEAKCKGQQN